MFVRKGTTRRKKHQSVKRQRRQSLPAQHVVSDAELGESSTANERGRSATTSAASSTLTLNEERHLVCDEGRYPRHQNYQPVSYGSVFLQLREASLESADMYDFLQRMHEIVWQSFVMTVTLLLLFGLPISMVAMGTSYLEECPKEPKIPVYLLVGGAFSFIHICILLWQQKRSRAYMLLEDSKDDPDSDENDVVTRSYRFTLYILSLFLIGWFALGNYWMFSIWQPNFSQPLHEPQNWCSYKLYTYTFYQILACYSIIGLLCLVFIGCLLAYMCGIMGR